MKSERVGIMCVDQDPGIPTTSGRDELSDTITGVLHAIASNGGIPKPSYSDG